MFACGRLWCAIVGTRFADSDGTLDDGRPRAGSSYFASWNCRFKRRHGSAASSGVMEDDAKGVARA